MKELSKFDIQFIYQIITISISVGAACGNCRQHRDNFLELESVTGNKLKKKHTYFLDTTHYTTMLISPNSQDFADNGLLLGKLCKRWQMAKKTQITCRYTKELPKESTNLGSDTNLNYQTGKSLECYMQMEGFGTKPDHVMVFRNWRILNDIPIRTRKV